METQVSRENSSALSLRARARDFSLLSALTSYPDKELEETIQSLGGALAHHESVGPWIGQAIQTGGLDEIRSTYVDLFDRGKGRISLYETEYGRMRGMSKGNDLADISGFYRAFGLALDDERHHEMLDHIGVELEFYAMLLAKREYLEGVGDREGCEIVDDARKKFLSVHLGPLARAVADRIADGDSSVYTPIFAWCGKVVGCECERLAVAVAPLDFYEDPDAKGDISCGAVKLPVIQ